MKGSLLAGTALALGGVGYRLAGDTLGRDYDIASSEALLAGVQPSPAPGELPNLIVITADDLGYGDLGCYGSQAIHTPNLDRMADEGARLTDFYSSAPLCSPARASLLTGRYAIRSHIAVPFFPAGSPMDLIFHAGGVYRHGVRGIPQDEVLLPEMLQRRGYRTALVGKWHLGDRSPHLPRENGFDYFYGPYFSNDMEPYVIYRNEEVAVAPPVDQSALTQNLTREAVQFIHENQERPFFLYYAQPFPHVPLHASEAFRGRSKAGLYGDAVEEIDWSVGKILEKLKELGIDRNTLVWFISDNGPWLQRRQNGGSAGLLREGKNSTWEGGMRVPCIAWWPGTVPAGGVSPSLIAAMDLFPTFAGLSGAKIPGDRTFDGVDITGVLKGAQGSPREFIYYYINDKLYAVRKGPWKAHFITHDSYTPDLPVVHEIPLLYHLEVDPSEKYDLSGKFPGIVEELTREYEKQKLIRPVPSEIDKVMENQN